MSKEIAEEYASSLADLTVNSKPLINMLTILAEENIDHAGVIVETVEKHLEKTSQTARLVSQGMGLEFVSSTQVHPDIKLPVLYLVDSIIKNVGGAYIQKFAQSIVNMFTRTFKQVDEKVRSQMFKLRETWHDVFPATKLYQLDVKVNLIDPAWPIQAQPQQSNIHVNPNFLKKTPAAPTTSTTSHPVTTVTEEEEKMRNILAKKEQELLMLQRKKVEMELEQTRRQLELAEKSVKKVPVVPPVVAAPSMPVAKVSPVVAPAPPVLQAPQEVVVTLPVKARLGPPVNKPAGSRIAPVSGALATARRDPRLARMQHQQNQPQPPTRPNAPIASNVFDIKPLDRIVKRNKNVITIDVRPDSIEMPVARDPRRRPPSDVRLDKRPDDRPRRDKMRVREERARKIEEERGRKKVDGERIERKREELRKIDVENNKDKSNDEKNAADEKNFVDNYMDKLFIADPKRINKLPPIPKINRDDTKDKEKDAPSPNKKRKEIVKEKKLKKDDNGSSKESSSSSSPEKKARNKEANRKSRTKEKRIEVVEKTELSEPVVAFKELKNYHKDRYMRRNKEKSESPEVSQDKMEEDKPMPEIESSNPLEAVVENKDVDLRVLPAVEELQPAPIGQKRSSTETLEGKAKKNKHDKFDILFGNEDVDLRQLPQVEEIIAPPPPKLDSPKVDVTSNTDDEMPSPLGSPKRDWNEVKEKIEEQVRKTPSKLDLVRAKLAEATKGKDRLGRPLLYSKSPSVERERRRTLSSEDIDLRVENPEEFDAEDHKKTISIIMNQAKEQFTDGQLDKNQYNTLMYQVLQLNEKLKLKEAKQRESLEVSKRKLKAHIHEENHKVATPKSSPNSHNTFGDIDERVTPAVFMETPPDSQGFLQDSDMRMNMRHIDGMDSPRHKSILPAPPGPPNMFMGPHPNWRQPRPRIEEYVPRRFRGPAPPFFRGKFDRNPRMPFEPRMPMAPLPVPKIGMCQGECPLQPYERTESPPPLGAPVFNIPSTDFKVLEYIDRDPVKTIQIDGVPREIRFYGERAIIMLDWDDPREIKFLPGFRRITFDNKDSVVLNFNEPYKQVEIDDQVFDIRFGAPTRELYINGRWFECFFGGQPLGVIIDGKPRLVQLEGPLPQVDIGKEKRTDLVAGKINLIVNATQMCPVYLDAKVQKFLVNGQFFTIRFVDALRTVLINEQPFRVEYGDLPKPIFVGNEKYFIRFSALPRNVKPGYVQIEGMEGSPLPMVPPTMPFEDLHLPAAMEVDEELETPQAPRTPSPEREKQGLDMLASVMPSSMEAPASASEYSLAEPLFIMPDKIPGLEAPVDEKPPATPAFPILGNINVTDLFAKLVATGIVQVQLPNDVKPEEKQEPKGEEKQEPKVEEKPMPRDDRRIRKVDLMRPESLRVKQPGIVSKLYGGMQCSGCGARFPPEHTVRYSQHLDWHFRQNRRERDSARRAHSRHWHYDLCDWVQYEEVEDLEEREKSWFETGGAEGAEGGESAAGAGGETAAEAPSVAAGAPVDHCCALCGDKFDQFYNEDKEEWHLRNSVKHEGSNYHPMCFEDYKTSLTKEEVPQESADDVVAVEPPDEAIEITDADDVASQSDNESVVEVVEEEKSSEPVEIDEGEEDDVVFKAEPVEEVLVQDDADTDDETTAERAARDLQAELDFSKVKVKQEPLDPDDEPIITAEEETVKTSVDTTHTTVLSSIDGNVQLEATAAAAALPSIRINISKTIPSFISTLQDDRMLQDISADDEPLPPGEEPELEYVLKPHLEGVSFSRQPPIQKGSELSGLCSIM